MEKKLLISFLSLILMISFSSCQKNDGSLANGYFTAESNTFNVHGWKEFVTIYVNSGYITTVEFNAKDANGFVRSWDMDYMRKTKSPNGNKLNKYQRAYTASLISLQDASKIEPVAGGRRMHSAFVALANAAVIQARKAQKEVAYIDLPESEYPNDI